MLTLLLLDMRDVFPLPAAIRVSGPAGKAVEADDPGRRVHRAEEQRDQGNDSIDMID